MASLISPPSFPEVPMSVRFALSKASSFAGDLSRLEDRPRARICEMDVPLVSSLMAGLSTSDAV